MLSIYIKLKVEIEMNNKEIKFSNTKGFRGFLLIGGLAFLIIMGYFYIGGLIKANRLKSDCILIREEIRDSWKKESVHIMRLTEELIL